MSHGLHSEPSDQWVTQEVTKEILQSGDCGGHAHTRSCINIQWIWPRLVPRSRDYKNVHTFWRHHLWRLNAETHHSAESLRQTHSAYLSDPRSGWQKCLHSSSAGRRKLKMCEQMRVFIFPQRKTWQIVPGGSLTCLLIKLCILKFTQKAETQACARTYTHTHRMTRVNKGRCAGWGVSGTPQLSVDIAHWFCSTAQAVVCLGCVCLGYSGGHASNSGPAHGRCLG